MTDQDFKDNLVKRLKNKELTLEEALVEVFKFLMEKEGDFEKFRSKK